MNRRTFVLGTTAASLSAARPFAWQARAVELGSIDGSVSGNNFTADTFLEYLSSIKFTWAMVSLPAAALEDDAAIRAVREHADRLGIRLQLAYGSVCPSAKAFNASSAPWTRRSHVPLTRRRSSARPASAAFSARIRSGRRSTGISTT
jgi:hypothetical protein